MADLSQWLPGAAGEAQAARAAELAAFAVIGAELKRSKRSAYSAAWVQAMRQLNGIEDPLARKLLRLHRDCPADDGCDCDGSGTMLCRTTLVIAEHFGLKLP